MYVLFLKNTETGESRRFFSIPANISDFEGWVVVDGLTWAEANADKELVAAAVERYRQQKQDDDAN